MVQSVAEIRIGGSPELEGFLVRPERVAPFSPGVVLCHGFPSVQRPGVPSRSYQRFAERIATEQGWTVLAVSLRGCGDSQGQFSLGGWVEDLSRAVMHLRELGCQGVWLVGSTTGGSLCLLAGAADSAVKGVALMAPRADFHDWYEHGEEFVGHCRDVGVIRDPDYPESFDDWVSELDRFRPMEAMERLRDRHVLILHGSADRQVPVTDAIALADVHPNAELRIISGADHRIRHDPRSVAVLLGWLERQAAIQIPAIA